MKKLKKWYNKMLVNKYDGKNIDLLEMLGEKRPFLFCLPLYSPSLYTKYKVEKVAEAFFEGFNEGFNEEFNEDEELSKEIQRIFGTERTKTEQAFIDDIWGLKKGGKE